MNRRAIRSILAPCGQNFSISFIGNLLKRVNLLIGKAKGMVTYRGIQDNAKLGAKWRCMWGVKDYLGGLGEDSFL
ncbi:MAG: hypothetical protein JSU78_07745 [Deltaproteobacteria bacterium]|nr:MAG: hypothetical protein JSU78_07745 [Deltaproteobacteria bacterium]